MELRDFEIFDLKPSASLTEVRSAYFERTSEPKFRKLFIGNKELENQFKIVYEAYQSLLRYFSEREDVNSMEYYPTDYINKFLFNQGVYYLIKKDYIKAGERFQRCYEMNKKDVLTILHLSYILINRKNYYAAEKYLKEGLKVDRDNSQLWYYLGETYYGAGNPKKALTMYSTAISLKPANRAEIVKRINQIKEDLGEFTKKKKGFFEKIKDYLNKKES